MIRFRAVKKSDRTRIARRKGRGAVLAALLVLVASVGQLAVPSASAGFAPGAIGIGDPYFPLQGNGGYDVTNYDISVRYDPRQSVMYGETTITAVTTQRLDSLYLDFNGMTVRSVRVDGSPTNITREGEDLRVPFVFSKVAGSTFVVTVVYDGTPVSAARAYDYQATGWMRTSDGIVVASQPNGASKWFPANNHPSDKAVFSITTTVPAGIRAVSNGLPGPTTIGPDGWESTTWRTSQPMASYLATVAIGDYTVSRSDTAAGLPLITAVGSVRRTDAEELGRLGEVIAFLEGYLGAYPNETGGAIVTSDNLNYALETQTRPVYGGNYFYGANNPQATMVMAHEEAHQWFGNRATVAQWRDIWLNEGFATYMDWLWTEREGYESVDQVFQRLACRPNNSSFGVPGYWGEAGDPGPTHLFDRFVYDRGAMTLQVLRRTVGDAAFFSILRQWAAPGDGTTRTTDEFISLSETVSGRQLDGLFTTWLYTQGKPAELSCSSVSIPSAPTGLAITSTSAAPTLTWRTPESNGGGYITGYTVTARNDADGSSRLLARTNTYARSQLLAGLDPAQSYTLAVTAENDAGTSAPATAIFAPSVTAGTPSISGTPKVGAALRAAPGAWGPGEVALSYQWSAAGVAIPGATGPTYVVGAAYVAKAFTVAVTGSKPLHSPATSVSAPTAAAAPGTLAAATPTITGTARVGVRLTAVPGTWGPAPVSLSYTWAAGGVTISGAIAAVYTPTAADAGKTITVTVRGAKTAYNSASRTSAPTATIARGVLTSATPTISGIAKVGSILTADAGTWGPSPVSLRYQWKANGTAISGATSRSYKPVISNVGNTLSVAVTGSKAGYASATRTSAATKAVTK